MNNTGGLLQPGWSALYVAKLQKLAAVPGTRVATALRATLVPPPPPADAGGASFSQWGDWLPPENNALPPPPPVNHMDVADGMQLSPPALALLMLALMALGGQAGVFARKCTRSSLERWVFMRFCRGLPALLRIGITWTPFL